MAAFPATPHGQPSDVLTILAAVDDMAATVTDLICRDADFDRATVLDVCRVDLFAWAQDLKRLFGPVSVDERAAIRDTLRDSLGGAA